MCATAFASAFHVPLPPHANCFNFNFFFAFIFLIFVFIFLVFPQGPNSKESLVLPFRYVAKSYLTKSESDKSEASQLPLSEVYRQLGSTASEHAFQLHSFSFFLFSFSTLRHPNFARRPAAFPYGKRQFPAAVAAAAAEDLLQQQQESARAASRSAANAHMNMMI